MSKETEEYLFVYGTLKSDMNNDMYHLLAKNARFIDDAVWNGKLYMVEDYPGAVPSDNQLDKVYGELYLLNNPEKILPALDEYEECSDKFLEPTLFKRIKGDVKTIGGEIIKTWIYIYNLPVDNLKQIKSGNFTAAKK
ncbi:MAG: gamma-glutamylcyclotransferase [Deltaproteobacteria bacterium]|jgi:gamma-glutamylcyclotransferase (GGCT)/AIG2-like uncharacterized protein YtfP|nr:gamma-glutamylcyclotransferase [Deltaproteobacteria bacterium]